MCITSISVSHHVAPPCIIAVGRKSFFQLFMDDFLPPSHALELPLMDCKYQMRHLHFQYMDFNYEFL